MSISHYRRALREVEAPREIERRILADITGRLADKARIFDTAETPFDRLSILADGLRTALSDNQRLWGALKYDLANPENALSPELRASLLSIAIWVEKNTSAVLGGAGSVQALVDVNANILAALSDTQIKKSA